MAGDVTRQATADLVTVAFFFLLRVGVYTMPRNMVRTRTVQIRVQDATFRRADGSVIPHTSTLADLSAPHR